MARQTTTPVQFKRSTRKDTGVLMSSARAGLVVPVGYIPLLPGDSASGRVGIDVALKEMPKPLLNAVHANLQAWFVPKSAFPQFSSRDEVTFSMQGEQIKALGQPDRDAPPYFYETTTPGEGAIGAGLFFKTLGLHIPDDQVVNTDVLDAYSLVYNFRLAAHSSRLTRRKYFAESGGAVVSQLSPAFWPSSRLSRVVPDYERALVVGSLDLDVAAGRMPVSGLGIKPGGNITPVVDQQVRDYEAGGLTTYDFSSNIETDGLEWFARVSESGATPQVFTEMAGQQIMTSLADIDKARTSQTFAKLRTAYAGNDATGFDNDDAIVATLMQGLSVPEDQFKRPWLLDSKRVPVGFAERHATDAANLDASVTVGRASGMLSLNVPQQDVGGIIIFTVEVLPERVDERMSDEFLYCTHFSDLPNALRDVQRVEPVDLVLNRRVDAKHTSPSGLYGYEPMNDRWQRDFTRLGGDFYQSTPGGGWTENRSNIWQTEIIDPTFSETHYLAPVPFPHDVFADQNADAFEIVCRHNVSIVGLTQFGDVLAENNDDYAAITSIAGPDDTA